MVSSDIEYPGTDISQQFYPYLRTELVQNILSAKVDASKLKLTASETLFDHRIKNLPKTPGAYVEGIQTKVRFACPGCSHKWTSGLGQFAAVIKQQKLRNQGYSVDFRVIAYWFECKACKRKGDMKAYEDEMERVSTKIAKTVLTKFGFQFEKPEKGQRKGNPRSDHIQQLCEACRLGVCTKRNPKPRRARRVETE